MQLMINDNIPHRKHDLEKEDWLDIGLAWNLLEANRRAMKDIDFRIEGTVEDGARLHGQVWVKKGAKNQIRGIHRGTRSHRRGQRRWTQLLHQGWDMSR